MDDDSVAIEDDGDWPGDVMKRRPHAQFLTAYIEKRMELPGSYLTVAVDAEWGAGKSFFVNSWARDLAGKKRGTLEFDAWKNDTTADPMVGFMAEMHMGMTRLRKQLPIAKTAARKIADTTSSLLRAGRRSLAPAGTVLLSGMTRKLTGVALEEVFEAAQSGGEINFDDTSLLSKSAEQLEKSLDILFKKSLEDHRTRTNGISSFKITLQKLVEQLRDEKIIEGPLYIFVDELDRCRPDYAIRLLEGIKHLFAVPGVVFIVSTNLHQLSRAIQAVYGPSFDGATYLQRFFDFESTLPQPNYYQFSLAITTRTPFFRGRQVDNGLSDQPRQEKEEVPHCLSLIAEGFEISLRTLERTFMASCAAASAIRADAQIAILWLFFLTALKNVDRAGFASVAKREFDLTSFKKFVDGIGRFRHLRVEYTRLNASRSNYEPASLGLSDLLSVYYGGTYRSIGEIRTSSREAEYPQRLLDNHLLRSRNDAHRSNLADYVAFVDSAGLLG